MEGGEKFLAKIQCLTCYEQVKVLVKPTHLGRISGPRETWYTVICPKCEKLAYNSQIPPSRAKD